MGKVYNITVLFVLAALVGYVATEQYRTEALLRSVRDSRAIQKQQYQDALLVAEAQNYARPLVQSVQLLSEENAAMMERELQAAKVVGGLLEESNRLKVSLKEAVTKLKELNDANNKALDEIYRLEFKVKTLQAALDAIAKAKEEIVPPAPVDPPAPPSPQKSPGIKTIPQKVA